MAAKRMDLNRNCFFVLSGGLANPLGKHLALEMCRRFREQSLALLIDNNEELLQSLKKDIEQLNAKLSVVTCVVPSWQQVDRKYFAGVLDNVLAGTNSCFDLAVIAHNEGTLATRDLMEPQDVPSEWLDYVHEHLYAPVALNQQFLNQPELQKAEKLVLNITSTLLVQPMYFNGLHGSCKRARDMYFRAMAAEESRAKQLAVLSYAPGLLDSHVPQTDANNNVINLLDLQVDEKLLKLPRVQPLQSILKLINILEEISFISGHDVDYYDTFVL